MRCSALLALLPLLQVTNADTAPMVDLTGPVLRATLRVFSGTQDPEFEVSGKHSAELLRSLAKAEERRPKPERLGYRGFRLALVSGSAGRLQQLVYANAAAERLLLSAARAAKVISHEVETHVAQEIRRVQHEGDWIPGPEKEEAMATVAANCTAPVMGSDTVGPTYDVANDDCGFFLSHQYENNCYDYGTDIATNTFAQPGRGSGHKWQQNTCNSIRAAAESDGLVWQGTQLPASDPATGHYVALFIWPNTNFHWIRRDRGGTWSHKPGGSPVRNQDNKGSAISDPSQCDFSPWTQFCGYMLVVPSKVCTGAGHCINRAEKDLIV